MARCELGDGGGNAGQEFDLVVGDGLREADDAGVLLRGDWLVGELLEAGDEGLAKTLQAVSVGLDSGPLDSVEMLADLFGRMDAVVEVRDEGRDGALEIDVVLPQGVVGIEEQGLPGRRAEGCGIGGHRWIIWLGLRPLLYRSGDNWFRRLSVCSSIG